MKKMSIRIKANGKTEIKVLNGEGDSCMAFTRAIENALGVVQQRELLPEHSHEPVYVVETQQEQAL